MYLRTFKIFQMIYYYFCTEFYLQNHKLFASSNIQMSTYSFVILLQLLLPFQNFSCSIDLTFLSEIMKLNMNLFWVGGFWG